MLVAERVELWTDPPHTAPWPAAPGQPCTLLADAGHATVSSLETHWSCQLSLRTMGGCFSSPRRLWWSECFFFLPVYGSVDSISLTRASGNVLTLGVVLWRSVVFSSCGKLICVERLLSSPRRLWPLVTSQRMSPTTLLPQVLGRSVRSSPESLVLLLFSVLDLSGLTVCAPE